MSEMLRTADLPVDLATHVHDESHDEAIFASTELALTRAGRDVGTPIITFRPGAADEASFFGPVIAKIPRGVDASKVEAKYENGVLTAVLPKPEAEA